MERKSREETKASMGMVRFLDLQLLYGVAGAREQFEKLCAQLISSRYPNARSVRADGGDGGVDVFVGDQADPVGITVFQVKYFPNGLKESQKRQVRESFRQCRDNARFALREWILCVPLDLSQDEVAWFSQWSAKEAPALLPPARMDWWGETQLGHLLFQSANAGIKEAFFPEEQLLRLYEIQEMLTYLVDDLRTRPAQPDLIDLMQQQRTGNSWLRYKEEAYAPLYEEFAKIQEALERARHGRGPFPAWIPVKSAERPATYQQAHMGMPVNISLAFTLWPSSRHDFRFSGAFTTAFQQRLDELQERLVAYNSAVEAVRPTIEEALRRALLPALELAVQDPEYQRCKTNKEASPSPSYQAHPLFEWLERNTAPANPAPGKTEASWWIRPPLTILGWLLAGNTEQAGLAAHTEHRRLHGNDAQHAAWFGSVCANALEEIQAAAATQAFQRAQEEAFTFLAELTKSLLNVLLHIRFHQEGGIPPL